MVRLDRHIQEAVQIYRPQLRSRTRQLSLGLTPCLIDSLGFFQVCQLADTTSRAISYQHRMYYREEFNLWYATIDAYLRERHVPAPIRSFLSESTWNDHPPQLEQYWFPNMREVVFLTYIIEERGYPVWTADRCEAFYYLRGAGQTRSGRRRSNRQRVQRYTLQSPSHV